MTGGSNVDEVRRIVVPTSFPIGPVNSYLIVGDELALVDVGPRVPGAYEAMVQGLAEQGYAPKDVKRLSRAYRPFRPGQAVRRGIGGPGVHP